MRNPAGFNSVIGFRPSQGRVPGIWADVLEFGVAYESVTDYVARRPTLPDSV